MFVEESERKAALDAHSAAASFAEFMAAVTPCLASPPDVRVFDATRLDGWPHEGSQIQSEFHAELIVAELA